MLPIVLAALVGTVASAEVPADVLCGSRCVAAFDTCKSQPNANNAACAAQLAGCVNYNPFTATPFVTPTACSSSTTTSTTTSVTSVPDDVRCASRCVAAFVACQNQPNANHAECSANLAGCVNYNPFTGSTFVTPTACSGTQSSTAPSVTTVPDNVRCASRCVAAFVACQNQPNANHAECSANLAGCVNYNPFTGSTFVTPTACSGTQSGGLVTITSTTSCTGSGAGTTSPPTTTTNGSNPPPVVTAGGSHLEPAVLLAALGAAALL